MLLTERAIRQLIYNVLLEGVREDADALSALLTDAPEALSQFEPLSMKPKWVNWLADRYVRSKYPADDTLQDTLPVVVSFAAADAAISQKYNSNSQFKTAVDTSFPPGERKWNNPADAAAMSTTDMSTLLTLHKRPKDKININRADTSWQLPVEEGGNKIGDFGPWELYFPTSQQNSINIAGADPETHKPYTAWCTARTAGSNLFYNFAGRGVMLFYAINTKATPKDPKGRISLGFARGELVAKGHNGGMTVDGANIGLNNNDPNDPKTDKINNLQHIFGAYYTSILERAEAVVAEHGGEHPVKSELDAALQDVVKFKSMLSGLRDDDAGDLCRLIFGNSAKPVSLDVWDAAASHKSESVRVCIALNLDTPLPVLEKLASDTVVHVRDLVARNAKTPRTVLEKMAADSDSYVRATVAYNSNTPSHVLEKLAADPRKNVRVGVALNDNTSSHVLEKLAADRVAVIRTEATRALKRRMSSSDASLTASSQN